MRAADGGELDHPVPGVGGRHVDVGDALSVQAPCGGVDVEVFELAGAYHAQAGLAEDAGVEDVVPRPDGGEGVGAGPEEDVSNCEGEGNVAGDGGEVEVQPRLPGVGSAVGGGEAGEEGGVDVCRWCSVSLRVSTRRLQIRSHLGRAWPPGSARVPLCP